MLQLAFKDFHIEKIHFIFLASFDVKINQYCIFGRFGNINKSLKVKLHSEYKVSKFHLNKIECLTGIF